MAPGNDIRILRMNPHKQLKLIKEAMRSLHFGELTKDETLSIIGVIAFEEKPSKEAMKWVRTVFGLNGEMKGGDAK